MSTAKAVEVLQGAQAVIRSAHGFGPHVSSYAEGYAYSAIGQAIELLEEQPQIPSLLVNVTADLSIDDADKVRQEIQKLLKKDAK